MGTYPGYYLIIGIAKIPIEASNIESFKDVISMVYLHGVIQHIDHFVGRLVNCLALCFYFILA